MRLATRELLCKLVLPTREGIAVYEKVLMLYF